MGFFLRARFAGLLLLLGFAGVFPVSGCGKKSPPIRPERLAPKAVRGIQARNTAAGIRLTWPAPRRKVNNQPLENLKHFVILRASGANRRQCTMPGNPWIHITDIVATDYTPESERFYQYVDKNVVVGRWYGYRILAVDGARNISGTSRDEPVIQRGKPPQKAPPPRVEPGDRFLSLRMPAFPDKVVGWMLYRAPTTGTLPEAPYLAEALTGREYTDAGLTNGQAFRYAGSWVSLADNFPIEGELSDWIVAAPQDLVPPPVPTAGVAIAVKGIVDVRWERVEEPGVRYYVYRRFEREPGFVRITPAPLTENTFEESVSKGVYIYSISSIDAAGNESARGIETKVIVR